MANFVFYFIKFMCICIWIFYLYFIYKNISLDTFYSWNCYLIVNYFYSLKHWVPTVKEWWFAFVTNIKPNVQLLAEKTVEIYYSSKNSIGPHIAVVQKAIEPYLKVCR